MSNLKSIDRIKLEKIFEMRSGYVCNFSDRTFGDFVLENTGIDVYGIDKYTQDGTSKANRLRTFLEIRIKLFGCKINKRNAGILENSETYFR